jgi:putative peptidoglycan lipid II flippase
LLGFVRLRVIGQVFGQTHATDAFYAASIVPQMFYDLTIGAAISAALIPSFSEILEKRGKEELWRTLDAVLGLAWIVLAIVIACLVLLAHPLMVLIASGFVTPGHAGQLSLSVEMVRILLPSLFFLGTSAVLLSTLYSLRRFVASAFAPSLYHIGVIAGAVTLSRPLGILALPVGALAGSACQALVQLPALLKQRPRLRVVFELSPEVRTIVRLYLPVAAGLLISIAGQIIDLNFKSHLREGGITAMQFATTFVQFPIGIVVAAMGFAILPSISSDAAFGRTSAFKDTLASGIRLVLFLTLPAALGLIVLATPIVAVLFEHGRFTGADTAHTATAIIGYAIQIPFVGLDQLLIFSFYARKDTVTPMLVGVLGVAIYIVSALILMPPLQILGLALANTIQNSLHGIILLFLLFATIGGLQHRGVAVSLARTAAASAVMTLALYAVSRVAGSSAHRGTLAAAAVLAAALVIGLVTYVAAASLLRSQELGMIRDMLRRGAVT